MRRDPHIAIIGGGIAGLSAAWYLQQRGIAYTIYEASDRWGGLIRTDVHDGYILEFGPDAFITRKPWCYGLARELGLEDQLVAVNDTPERIYVLSNGRLVPLPDGLGLLVPTKIMPFLRSPLLSWWGKLRVLADWFIPAKDIDGDESLADFVTRRVGAEALDKLADPLLAGVYNAEMSKQSILATFPQYRTLEKKHGSLIRGMRATQAMVAPPDRPALMSFRDGIGTLINTLTEKLTGDLKLGAGVPAIRESEAGYTLQVASEAHNHSGVIIATPAHIAAKLLADIVPQAAASLRKIRYAGIGSMALGFHKDDVPHMLDAYGIVIPSSEGRQIDGMQWASSKWSERAPDDRVLLRVFFGGPHTRNMLDKHEDELVAIIRNELREILGISAAPHFTKLGIWEDGYPQYDVGHVELVDRIEAHLPESIRLAGNAYRGVGMPDTIRTARYAAQSY